MNATSMPSPSAASAPEPPPEMPVTLFRGLPLLWLLGSAAVWLVIASFFGLVGSLKFHDPGFLGSTPYLTYGRVVAASETALLYGFCAQGAFAISIWLFARLGRTFIVGPLVILIGVGLWNMMVTTGVLAIFLGSASGIASFQMPDFCAGMLLVGYLLIGICGLLTYHARRYEILYPSQWFAFGSLVWFPWIFATAALVVFVMPVRGVMQPIIGWWYAHNFDTIFLGFAGLGAIFYFIPKMTNKSLYSYYLAVLAFWMLALFGSWGGVPEGAPVPAWLVSLSVVGTVFTAVPIFVIAWNLSETARTSMSSLDSNPTTRFIYVALLFWIIASAQQIVGELPQVSAITGMTWFGVAQKELFRYGFFVMAAFGAAYYIVPRVVGTEQVEWCPKLAAANFWLMLLGILISYVSLLVAGVGEGVLLAKSDLSDVQIVKGTLMPLRVSTIGDFLIFAGTVVFLLNFSLIASRRGYAFLAGGKEGR